MVTRRTDARRRNELRRQAVAPPLAPPLAADASESDGADTPAVARYIADMAGQLESMAIAARLDLLAYFLAMARAESEASARADAPSLALSSREEPEVA